MLSNSDDGQSLKSPLKWAGGKRWLVRYMREYWRDHSWRRLVEPFCGGLAVALGLLPERALLNDVNPHLVNFLQWVQRGLVIEIPMENEKEMYYAYRERFNSLIRSGSQWSKEAAVLFYYLNRTGYNGLCRFNRKGEFNVPFGRYERITYRRDFLAYRPIFSKWSFTCMDFEEIALEPEDFVYADPPYDVEFTSYSREGFSWEDQERLAVWLANHPGPVVLSNQATQRVLSLYERLGYQMVFLEAPRMISCNGDRTKAREVLALRNIGLQDGRNQYSNC